MKNLFRIIPQVYSEPEGGGSAGMAELDKAIAVLGQVNVLIPVAFALGKSLVSLVKGATASGSATTEEAQAAIAGFEAASADVRQTAEDWLASHPRE